MKVLITGATGFVGKAVCFESHDAGYEVIVATRERTQVFSEEIEQFKIVDLSQDIDWENAFQGVDVVIHTAARAHVMNDVAIDPLAEFRKVNVEGTLKLAQQAADAGVKRFVFISSIKVNGEMTELEHPFTPDDDYIPTDPYGLSKYEAEQGLLALAKKTGMEVVIIRPPLVYGPDVKANFASMMKGMNKSIPLPFGAIHNKRSLVALDNLVSFIIHCADYQKTPQAANQVFLISDGEDVSTTELLHKVAKAFGKKALLLPIPASLMTLAAKLLGKGDVANRLFGSL
jgi:nucleoside-diphosphate-sugar epimerase